MLVWGLLLLDPGDPARSVLAADGIAHPTPLQVSAQRARLGLNGSPVSRYLHWAAGVTHGELGTSWATGRSVTHELGSRLGATLVLTTAALVISLVVALTLALVSAWAPRRWPDSVARAVSLAFLAIPGFLLGTLLLDLVVVRWGHFRVLTNGHWGTVFLPALTLSLGTAASWARILRASLLDAGGAAYLDVSVPRGSGKLRRLLVHAPPTRWSCSSRSWRSGWLPSWVAPRSSRRSSPGPVSARFSCSPSPPRTYRSSRASPCSPSSPTSCSASPWTSLPRIDPRSRPALRFTTTATAGRQPRLVTELLVATAAPPEPNLVAGRSTTRPLRRLFTHRGGQVGLGIAGLLALVVVGPLWPRNPNATDYAHQLVAPSLHHLLGTDENGRDELARTVAGARTTLGASLTIFALTTTVGLLIGGIAAAYLVRPDAVVTRVMDVLLGLLSMIIALAVVGALGVGYWNVVIAISFTGWAYIARIARSHVPWKSNPSRRHRRSAGISKLRIFTSHVLPAAGANAAGGQESPAPSATPSWPWPDCPFSAWAPSRPPELGQMLSDSRGDLAHSACWPSARR